MSSGSPNDPHSRNIPGKVASNASSNSEWRYVRWMTLVVSIFLLLIAASMRLNLAWFSNEDVLASDIFAKVGIVLFCMWLAWPAMEMIGRAPSGAALIVGLIIAAFLFLFQRKTIYLTAPALAVAIGVAVLVGWLRRTFK